MRTVSVVLFALLVGRFLQLCRDVLTVWYGVSYMLRANPFVCYRALEAEGHLSYGF